MSKKPRAFSAEFEDGQLHTRNKSYSDLKYGWRVVRLGGPVLALGFASSRVHAEQSARREFNRVIDDYSIPFTSQKAPLSAWARHELNKLMSDVGVDDIRELKKEIARRRKAQWDQCRLEIVPAKKI